MLTEALKGAWVHMQNCRSTFIGDSIKGNIKNSYIILFLMRFIKLAGLCSKFFLGEYNNLLFPTKYRQGQGIHKGSIAVNIWKTL